VRVCVCVMCDYRHSSALLLAAFQVCAFVCLCVCVCVYVCMCVCVGVFTCVNVCDHRHAVSTYVYITCLHLKCSM